MPKISEYPDAAPLTGTEFIPLVQAGQTVKATTEALQLNPATPEILDAFWLQGSPVAGPLFAADLDVISGGGGC